MAMPITNNMKQVDRALRDSSGDTYDLEVWIDLPGMKAGIVEAGGIQPLKSPDELDRKIDETCDRLRGQYSCDSLRDWKPVQTVREMFRKWGLDPTKHRPSSEALLRRVIKGEAFPRISPVVDIGNLGALEMGWPYGCYNRVKLSTSVEIRFGKPGEQYNGIGRQLMRLEDRPVFSDAHGPFGSPVSDSTRTMVTESTQELLAIVCVPESCCELLLEEATAKLAERLTFWCGASRIQKRIVKKTNEPACNYQIVSPAF
jgi:DNA/RNA-binding domain of Phe-tRNA-synthetase-like protein